MTGVCAKKVEDGVCCERCRVVAQVVAGLGGTPAEVLEQSLLIFLSPVCLDTNRGECNGEKEGRRKGSLEDKATQTDLVQGSRRPEHGAGGAGPGY